MCDYTNIVLHRHLMELKETCLFVCLISFGLFFFIANRILRLNENLCMNAVGGGPSKMMYELTK